MKGLNGGTVRAKEEEEQEEGMSAHSPCKKSPSSSSSLHKVFSLLLFASLFMFISVPLHVTHRERVEEVGRERYGEGDIWGERDM